MPMLVDDGEDDDDTGGDAPGSLERLLHWQDLSTRKATGNHSGFRDARGEDD